MLFRSALLQTTLQAWHTESGNAELPVAQALEFLWEALAEQKRERFAGNGVFLSTVHAAKGTEFDHVLLFDDWAMPNQGDLEEQRRAYYVGMTRARQTLCLLQDQGAPNPFGETLAAQLEGKQFLVRAPDPGESLPEGVLRRRYEILGLRDLYLDYAGRLSDTNPIHQHLEQLQTGETLGLRLAGAKIEVVNSHGGAVAILSKQAAERWQPLLGEVESLKVLALIERRVGDDREESYRKVLKAERWEVPVVEVVYRHG